MATIVCDVLPEPTLKVINLAESHAACFKNTKDNFSEVQKYIRNARCYISNLIGETTTTITTEQIKAAVRGMIYTIDIDYTQVDGTSIVLPNGIIVSRNANTYVIQHPDSAVNLLHALRLKATRQYAMNYDLRIDVNNNIVLSFVVLPNEILQLELFG